MNILPFLLLLVNFIIVSLSQHQEQISFLNGKPLEKTVSERPVSPHDKASLRHLSKYKATLRLKHILHQPRYSLEESLSFKPTKPSRPTLLRADFGEGTSNDEFTKSHDHDQTIFSSEYAVPWLLHNQGISDFAEERLPDPYDAECVEAVAKMCHDAYFERTSPSWIPVDGSSVNVSVGWDSAGLRGYVFSSDSEDLLIIALKGTSALFFGIGSGPTSKRDKLEDNLMFSCCCAAVDRTWWPVCSCADSSNKICDISCSRESLDQPDSYVNSAMAIYDYLRVLYPRSSIWFAGHSLAGAVGALAAYKFGTPAITFESPGERLYAYKMGWDLPSEDQPSNKIFHFGFSTDPIFSGTCKGAFSSCYISGYAMESFCHMGNICVLDYPPKTANGTAIQNHRLGLVLDLFKNKTIGFDPFCFQDHNCSDCGDWTFDNFPS